MCMWVEDLDIEKLGAESVSPLAFTSNLTLSSLIVMLCCNVSRLSGCK